MASHVWRQEFALPSRRNKTEPSRAQWPACEAKLDEVLETAGQAFYGLDRDWRLTHLNAAAAAHFGLPR